jgi:hypothetical protein
METSVTIPATILPTTVVNVKVQHIRPQYKNLLEWMSDPQNVYIGRRRIVFIDHQRFPPQDSMWHNPFKIGKDGTREQVLEKYDTLIRSKSKNPQWLKELFQLEGKNLGCWCVAESVIYPTDARPDVCCHGQLLVKLLQESKSQ